MPDREETTTARRAEDARDPRRAIPQVDQVLREAPDLERVGPEVARWLVRREVEAARGRAARGEKPGDVAAAAAARARALEAARIRRVINATGVVLHTNLGRAPLGPAALAALAEAAGAATVEYDLAAGARGPRAPVAATLAAALTGAEDALVVNNNAAALLLALAALARGREVIVSRGQLIEIGGEFRLPEVMEASGAILREVGTTNRTHARDYRRATGPAAALILLVHPSNYEVVGFTTQPPLTALVALAREADLPLLYDIGSGLLAAEEGILAAEPDARTALAAGCDLVCFSGDKLLGGPQAGILAGRTDLVERCRLHPIARAVRADKLTLAALEATLWGHATGPAGRGVIPTRRMLSLNAMEIRRRAEQIAAADPSLETLEGESVTGGGSLPGRTVPTVLLAIRHPQPETLAAALRAHEPPVVARVERGRLVLDLRTVDPADDPLVARAVRGVLARTTERTPGD